MGSIARRLWSHGDLWAAALITVAGVAAVIVGLAPLPRIVLAMPLVLFLPGFALASMLLPVVGVPLVERLLMAAGLSIGLAILVGLAMAWWGIALEPVSWALALGSITIVGLLAALIRRLRADVTGPGFAFATMPRLGALMVLVATLMAANVVLGNWLVAGEQEAPVPVQLWLVPVSGQVNEALLGVRSSALGGNFRIVVSATDTTVADFAFSLAPEETWQRIVSFAPELRRQRIVARLYEGSATDAMRFVVLDPQTNPAQTAGTNAS